jgi:hypothetical protein
VVQSRAGKAFGVGDAFGAAGLELGGDLEGAGQRVGGQFVDHAEAMGLLAGHRQATQDHLQRFGFADDARQPLGAAAAREDADPGFGQADGLHRR